MIKYTTLLFSIIFLSVLSGCEVPFGENYIDIEHEETTNMAIDLNAITDGQAILINKSANLEYSLSAFGKGITAAKFTLGNKIWEIEQQNGAIYISKDEITQGEYTLTCEMYVKTGTGSVADQFNQEYYVGTISWPVIVDYTIESPKLITTDITDEKYIRINWQKPQLSHLEVKEYYLTFINNDYSIYYSVRISADATSYIDKLYAGEGGRYSLSVLLDDNSYIEDVNWNIGEIELENSIDLSSSITSDGNIEVKWNNPYKCNVVVTKDYETVVPTDNQSSVTFVRPSLSESYWSNILIVKVEVLPYGNISNIVFTKYCEIPYYATIIGEQGCKYIWNKTENVIYVMQPRKISSYQLPDFTLIASKELNSDYTTDICSSPNSSLIAIRLDNVGNNNYISILKGKSLDELCSITANDISYNGLLRQHLMYLTQDNKLVYFSGSKGIVCDASTGNKLKSFSIDTNYTITYPTLSPDGKTLLCEYGNLPHNISLNDYNIIDNKIITNNIDNYFFMFSPSENDKATIRIGSKVYTYDIKNNIMTNEVIMPYNSSYLCSDPLNGNILAFYNDNLYVVSPTDGKSLFFAKNNTIASLICNYLVSYEGKIMNLQNYFK